MFVFKVGGHCGQMIVDLNTVHAFRPGHWLFPNGRRAYAPASSIVCIRGNVHGIFTGASSARHMSRANPYLMFRNHYRVGVCKECGTECVMRRRVPLHQVHLLLTVFTLGFWGPCWIITLIAAAWEPWRCRECKRPQPDEPMEPAASVGNAEPVMHRRLA